MKKVGIIMGSSSDFDVTKPAIDILKSFGIEVEVRVMSAHRTPDQVITFSKNARENGFGVIIGVAGKAAHLAGVIAGNTSLPVIGLPVKSSTMDGMDSLLSTVQMPNGVPVATVAINGGQNAGILAVQMLAISCKELADKLDGFKADMLESVETQDRDVQSKL